MAIDHTKDNEILEAVYTILRKSAKDEKEQITLSAEDIKELDSRWDNYKNAKSKTYTLEDAKEEIRKKIKGIKH